MKLIKSYVSGIVTEVVMMANGQDGVVPRWNGGADVNTRAAAPPGYTSASVIYPANFTRLQCWPKITIN